MNHNIGFLIIDKERGLTSHDCVKKVRKLLETKKVGHTGTLDPEVTGVLPLAIGKATRLINYLKKEKSYIGTIQLGIETDTDDLEGNIIRKVKLPNISKNYISHTLKSFQGNITQIPPQYSSVHINGERAYLKARKGEKFEIPERRVHIYKIKLVDFSSTLGQLRIEVDCSEGTYIRSLARDIGRRMNSLGCLKELRRTSSSGFNLNKTVKISEIKNDRSILKNHLITPQSALGHLNSYVLTHEDKIKQWSHGQYIDISKNLTLKYSDKISNDKYLQIKNSKNDFLGIGEIIENKLLKPKVNMIAKD